MAITQIIATLPAVLNDSETFYEDIAIRNNSLVTVSFPSINTWATQANALAVEVNDKAAQVAAQAVDGGYSQTYINTNFVGVNNAQTIAGIKTFSANPISSAAQSTNSNALTKYSAVVKNSGDETIAGVKTFSSSPIVPTPTGGTQAVNKDYVDNVATLNINALDEKITPENTDNLAIQETGGLLKKLSFANLVNWIKSFSFGWGQTWQNVTSSRSADVVYTNNTGKPIMVVVTGVKINNTGSGKMSAIVDYVEIAYVSTSEAGAVWDDLFNSVSFIVPNNTSYKITGGNNAVYKWTELR